ncbi:MAG: DUF2971 domain-containing protein [Thermodesulfobacteriota bacterium]|nr:DUF2971 domain-containing protein [Thermodesulfobacteriota bacterium]
MTPKLEAHLSVAPPAKLYHYTSTEAFRCIVEHKKIWATDAFYMNDNQEILHALNLFQETCRSLAKSKVDHELAFLEKLLGELNFQKTDQPHIFTVSFSASRDQLSQWRAYTRNGGYALAFNGDALSHVADTQGYRLVKCVYQQKEKIQLIEEYLDAKLSVSAVDPDILAVTTAIDFLEIAAMMKHQGFAEENEWRLISTSSRLKVENIEYRSALRYLIPYLEVDIGTTNIPQLNDPRDYIGINEVLVGPVPEPELSWRSCMQLLQDRMIFFEQITPSSTPFRAS